MKKKGFRKPPAIHVFKPTVFEDLGPKDILIESPEQLKRICEKRGLMSSYLENRLTVPRSRRHKRIYRFNKKLGRMVRVR